MSWSELERLVEEAESNGSLRSALSRCRSNQDLVLAARRLGYRVTRLDLARAYREHCAEDGHRRPGTAAPNG